MSLFKVPQFPIQPQLPLAALNPLAAVTSAVTGAKDIAQASGAALTTTVDDINKTSQSAFKIPVTNPVTGALQLVQGGLGEGLKGLNDTAHSALETASQIPVITKDGIVKVLPGGPDGLKAIKDNIDEAVKNAPTLPGVPEGGNLPLHTLGAIIPTAATSAAVDDINKASDSAFKIPITDPVTGALHLVKGGLGEGLKGLSDTAQSALQTAAQIPVVTKDGVVKLLPGGPEGLKAIKDNIDEAVKNAPKIPTDGKLGIPGLGIPSIPGLSGLPGVPGLPNGADPLSLISNGLLGGASTLGGGLLGGISGLSQLQSNATSFIEHVKEFITTLTQFFTTLLATIQTPLQLFKQFIDPSFGLQQMEDLLWNNITVIVKWTFLVILGAAGCVWTSFVLTIVAAGATIAFLPVLWGGIVLFGFELIGVKYIRWKKSQPVANGKAR